MNSFPLLESGDVKRQRPFKVSAGAFRFLSMMIVVGISCQGAGQERVLEACATGVPPAHWSEEFSFGIEFTKPVRTIGEAAYQGGGVVGVQMDRSDGRRWHVRMRPGWSADSEFFLLGGDSCADGVACSVDGMPLARGVAVRIPARPEGQVVVSVPCEGEDR